MREFVLWWLGVAVVLRQKKQVLRRKSGADDFDFAGLDPDKPRRISAKYQLTRSLRRKLSDPGISWAATPERGQHAK